MSLPEISGKQSFALHYGLSVMVSLKVTHPVITTNNLKVTSAGTHNILKLLDSRLRGNDENGTKLTFYEFVISLLTIIDNYFYRCQYKN